MMSWPFKKSPSTISESLFTFELDLLKHATKWDTSTKLIYRNKTSLSRNRCSASKGAPSFYVFRPCMRRSDNRQLGRTRGDGGGSSSTFKLWQPTASAIVPRPLQEHKSRSSRKRRVWVQRRGDSVGGLAAIVVQNVLTNMCIYFHSSWMYRVSHGYCPNFDPEHFL